MIKINFLKDVLKIILGFLVFHTAGNIYFFITGNLPTPPPGAPELTPELNKLSLVIGLILIGVLVYLFFLKKWSGKINLKDVFKMLIGVFVLGILIGCAMLNWAVGAINLILALVFTWICFFKK